MTDRRTVLLAGLAAVSVGVPLRGTAQTNLTLDGFIALSATLTGVPASQLDRRAAQIMYGAFAGRGLLPGLAELAHAGTDHANPALGNEVVAAWYSGVCNAIDGPVMATYTGALLWDSASFLHPPGLCGGVTGYWGAPPTT